MICFFWLNIKVRINIIKISDKQNKNSCIYMLILFGMPQNSLDLPECTGRNI